MSNDYDSMKHFLNIMRGFKKNINEAVETGDQGDENRLFLNQNSKISVFIKNDSTNKLDDNTKNELSTIIDQFITATGLMMISLDLEMKTNQLILKTTSITEPIEFQRAEIVFDTNSEEPQINFSNEMIPLDADATKAINSIKAAWENPEMGRIKLKQLAQSKI